MTCPDCDGAGYHVYSGYVQGTTWGEFPPVRCRRCAGTGAVSDESGNWQELGRRITEFREDRDLSQRELAARIGMKPIEVSDAEAGRIDPSEVLKTATRWAEQQIARDAQ